MMIQVFDYIAPDNLEGVCRQIKDSNAQVLVGDQAYVSLLKKGTSHAGGLLVSLKNLPDLAGIEVGRDYISLGVTTTFADIKKHEFLSTLTVLKEALASVKDPHLLNNSTIGGVLYHGHIHHSPIAGALMALNAVLQITSGENASRTISVDEFFSGSGVAGLLPGELIRSVRIPAPGTLTTGYKEIKVLDGTRPICGLAVAVSRKDERVDFIRLVLTSCVNAPLRLTKTEGFLINKPLNDEQIGSALGLIDSEVIVLNDTLQVKQEYLYHLIKVLLRNSLQ